MRRDPGVHFLLLQQFYLLICINVLVAERDDVFLQFKKIWELEMVKKMGIVVSGAAIVLLIANPGFAVAKSKRLYARTSMGCVQGRDRSEYPEGRP